MANAAESLVQVTEGSGKKLHTMSRTIGANTTEDEVVIFGEPGLASYTTFVNGASTAVANTHLIQIMAGASLNVRIRRIEVHQAAAATAAVLADIRVIRLTTAGTGGTSALRQPLNPSAAAAGATAQSVPTAKGTEGNHMAIARPYLIQTIGASTPFVNPVAVWDFDRLRAEPLIIAAGVANGICVSNQAAYAAATVSILVWFDESSF